MDGFTFSTPIRVRFADTDAQGVAHNSAYVVWFEVARVEYLREFAGGYQALRDQGIEALVLESFCRYRIPARFDDELVVHTRCVGPRGARFRYEYAIVRGEELARRRSHRARLRRRGDVAADARSRVARGRDPRRRGASSSA